MRENGQVQGGWGGGGVGGGVQDVWILPFYTHGIRNRLLDDSYFSL